MAERVLLVASWFPTEHESGVGRVPAPGGRGALGSPGPRGPCGGRRPAALPAPRAPSSAREPRPEPWGLTARVAAPPACGAAGRRSGCSPRSAPGRRGAWLARAARRRSSMRTPCSRAGSWPGPRPGARGALRAHRALLRPRAGALGRARERGAARCCGRRGRGGGEPGAGGAPWRPRARAAARVLPNLVDVRAPPEPRPPARRFVAVCTLRRVKGVDLLLEAVALLAPRRPWLRLTVVGDGPERGSRGARAPARRLGRVRFAGALPRERALAEISAASVFVSPSRARPSASRRWRPPPSAVQWSPRARAARGHHRRDPRGAGAAEDPRRSQRASRPCSPPSCYDPAAWPPASAGPSAPRRTGSAPAACTRPSSDGRCGRTFPLQLTTALISVNSAFPLHVRCSLFTEPRHPGTARIGNTEHATCN